MIAKIINPQTIQIYDLTQFDPYAILHSGQVFRYWSIPNGWLVMSAYHWAEIRNEDHGILIYCDNAEYFYHYFDLETDYNEIKRTLVSPKLHRAISQGSGVRILHGDFVEMVLSFIISANNNIKRFTKTINQICEQYGTMTACKRRSFPDIAQCTMITVEDFKRLGCGYRAPYLVKAIQQLRQIDEQQLRQLSNSELQHELIKISGVGPKVAACIMLFAFHRLDVAPVDTWIKKAISQLLLQEQKEILNSKYAGVAQQYIYYFLQHLQEEVL